MTEMAARPRNRAETEAAILDAARRVIARDGFTGLGVNALAAEAGYDKKLITRYFGGIDGVVEALGGETGFWVGTPPPPASPDAGYADRMAALLRDYAETLESAPLLRRVLVAELTSPSTALTRMEQARSQAMGRWMAAARGDLTPPEGVDAPAVNAVILAALHYLSLRRDTLPSFAGVDLSSESGRARINRALERLLRRGLAGD